MSRAAKKTVVREAAKPPVDPAARAVVRLRGMTGKQLFDVAVRAGIYTPRGQPTPPYRVRRSK